MDRINQILQHSLFKQYMEANEEREKNRIFCRHNMSHVMDVARIAYILNIEEEHYLSKELIYGAALLHDIGRHIQYDTGEKHADAGARLAPEILMDCGYDDKERAQIVSAIKNHSNKSMINDKDLDALIAKADVLSRVCYTCQASNICNWKADRKNKELQW